MIFCHFRSFFALLHHYWPGKLKFGKNVKNTWKYPFTHVYHKSRSYDVWFLRYKAQNTEFFVILGHFLTFDPPNNPKNQNFEKLEILAFYTCVTQMTITWCISNATDNVFSFWTILWTFMPLPLTTQRIKILKKWKKTNGDIIILHKRTINDNHMIHGSWDMKWSATDRIFCHLGSSLTAQKMRISHKRKTLLGIS